MHNRGLETSRLCSRVLGEGGNLNAKKTSSGHCCYEHGAFTQHYAGSPRPLEMNNLARHQSQNTKPSPRELSLPGGRCAGGSAEPRGADEEELLSRALTATPQLARSLTELRSANSDF